MGLGLRVLHRVALLLVPEPIIALPFVIGLVQIGVIALIVADQGHVVFLIQLAGQKFVELNSSNAK